MATPKIIFIVPYRNRPQQRTFFSNYMKIIMEDTPKNECEIYFSHQVDNREFNRGGMKNIGFLAMKAKYPQDYKNITYVFNDIDTIPHIKGLLDYNTTPGIVKHFYGFKHALGGFFSIKGVDFERINGFPNFWAWGFEDNTIFNRVQNAPNLSIDYSTFWSIGDHNILQLFDSVTRTINLQNKTNMLVDNTQNGLTTIRDLQYSISGDNSIDVTAFECMHPYIPKNMIKVSPFTEQQSGGVRKSMRMPKSNQLQQAMQQQAMQQQAMQPPAMQQPAMQQQAMQPPAMQAKKTFNMFGRRRR